MKRILTVMVTAGAVAWLAWGVVLADSHESGSKVIPVEIFVCSYNDRQDEGDLDDAVDEWNGYMDEQDIDSYAGWTLVPHYYTDEQDFDFIWMGAWKDGNAMGAGTDNWLATGGEYADRFAEVATCNTHVNLASINLKMPPDGATPQTAVLVYSNCNVEDGATYDQVNAAAREWAQVLTDAGSEAGIFHQFPIYGGGGETPDFLWMTSYPNHTALGADYERMGNGQLYMKSDELFADLLDCDVSRVYNAQNRRFVQLR